MRKDYDLIVIGSGPGGYVAAARAAQLGFRTAIVERAELGGVCLNWGCIPTKALLHAADISHTLRGASQFGIIAKGGVEIDLAAMVARSRSVADQLSQGIAYLMRKHGVDVLRGSARLIDKCQLRVAGEISVDLQAPHIILATGARARSLPFLPAESPRVWSSRIAMTPPWLPKRLLIVGAGAIGIEFASLYNDLGTEVTVVEALDRILPAEDAEISEIAAKQLSQRGIRLLTGATICGVDITQDAVIAELRDNRGNQSSEHVDCLLPAIGVIGNVENLGLEALGADIRGGFLHTDAYCRSNVVGLYAIGDVAGGPWLAHKASHEGILCVETIAGVAGAHPIKPEHIPGCTYCRPQVASIGLTERDASERGLAVRVGRARLQANGKALAIGDSQGLVKTLFDATTGEFLGAHMIGPEVTEQIQGYAIALAMEATEEDLKRTVFPHPTLSESMHESVLDAFDMSVNQ